jgi:hypothetical protein
LAREIKEECGMNLKTKGELLFKVFEIRESRESKDMSFKMCSEYYACTVEDGRFPQKLDAYEEALGFEPRWISLGIGPRSEHEASIRSRRKTALAR